MPASRPLRIVFVEDLPSDAELARRTLAQAGIDFVSVRVDNRPDLLNALETTDPELVISDYMMPSFNGMEALRIVRERDPLLPFIVLTGSMNEDTAVACMKAGASDYVIKEHMVRLPFAVEEALAHRESLRNATEHEERYRSIFRKSETVMLLIDMASGVIVDANQAASDFYQSPLEDLIGLDINASIQGLSPEARRVWAEESKAKRGVHIVNREKRADGSIRDVEIHASPVEIGRRSLEFVFIHDITEKTRNLLELKNLTSRLHYYLSTSPTITYAFRIEAGRAIWQWISENVERILGYTVAEALAPDWWLGCVHPEDRKEVIRGLPDLVRTKTLMREYRFIAKTKKTLWIRDELRVLVDETGAAEVVGTLTDVSAGKQAEDELALKSAALEAAANAMVITDRAGDIQWVNPAFERLSGYARAEVLGRNPRDLVKSGKQDEVFYRDMRNTIAEGKVWSGSVVNRRKSGELYVEEMTITPVFNKAHSIVNYIAFKSDVTRREEERKLLVVKNREKDLLLREIHHRVNNNMQLISSLLHLSSGELSPDDTMREIERRIQSLAIIHQQFYESEDISSISFSKALRNIVEGVREECPKELSSVPVIFDTEDALLELERAIPAGLIVAELTANAFIKWPGNGSGKGSLFISLRALDHGKVEIGLKSAGIALPEDFDFSGGDSLGGILVDSLAKQLQGEVTFTKGAAATATLRFTLSRREAEAR